MQVIESLCYPLKGGLNISDFSVSNNNKASPTAATNISPSKIHNICYLLKMYMQTLNLLVYPLLASQSKISIPLLFSFLNLFQMGNTCTELC